MIRLYLIRHGETPWNKMRRLQGQADIELNEFGRHLARETAAGLKDIPFAAVYTSPLKRARETAELVSGGLAPVYEDDRITEMGFGIYEGKCVSDTGWDIPDPGFRKFFDDPENYFPPEGGESFTDVLNRESGFLKEICAKKEYDGKNILVSTHGAALCGLLNILMMEKPLACYWDGKVHKNCAVSIAEADENGFHILQLNHVYYKDEVQQW